MKKMLRDLSKKIFDPITLLIFCLFSLSISSNYVYAQKLKTRVRSNSEKNATRKDLLLIAGIQKTLDIEFDPCTPFEECVRVANGALMKIIYVSSKRQLVFTPAKRGETTVTIRDDKGDIRLILDTVVSDNNLDRRAEELRDLLQDIEGIHIRIMAEKIVVDGEVVVISDLNRLYSVLNDDSYRGIVLNLVTVSPAGLQIMAERMQAEINKPNVKVRVFNRLFLVEGQVDSADEAKSVLNIAASMLQGFALPTYQYDGRNPIDVKVPRITDPIVPRLTIAPAKPKPLDKMIKITVDFVELSKDYLRNFGFSWVPSLDTGGSIAFGQSTTGGVTSQGSGSLSGTIGNLFPKLNSAQNAGYARILEQSVLITRSGVTARLSRQLNVPVQVVNERGGGSFQVQSIGPRIEVTPATIGGGDDINLNLHFSYAGLAGKQANAAIILNHDYSSSLIVKNGESAAVVNALSNVISTAFNKDPPGGTVPANPLFTLLRSKAFQKQKSQFVVFMTPQILESASLGTEDIKNRYGLRKKQQ